MSAARSVHDPGQTTLSEPFQHEAVNHVLAGLPLRHLADPQIIAESLSSKWKRPYDKVTMPFREMAGSVARMCCYVACDGRWPRSPWRATHKKTSSSLAAHEVRFRDIEALAGRCSMAPMCRRMHQPLVDTR